jgi:hypothetical protein
LEISLVNDWEFESATWARVLNCGVTVESLCVELGCSRHVLTSLLKEHCGMSAGDFLDGLKFSRLKSAMHVRLREAASERATHADAESFRSLSIDHCLVLGA